jgi:uncharacterized protein YlaI
MKRRRRNPPDYAPTIEVFRRETMKGLPYTQQQDHRADVEGRGLCGGKKRLTFHEATFQAKRLREDRSRPAHHYKCKYCGFWHVGKDDGVERNIERVRK